MAFMVNPVRPRVGFISGAVFSAISILLDLWVAASRLATRQSPYAIAWGEVKVIDFVTPIKIDDPKINY
jgi:hypothetical protein